MPREKIPEGQKRVKVFGRVDPLTLTTLQTMGENNFGRAIDRLAILARAQQAALTVLVIANKDDTKLD